MEIKLAGGIVAPHYPIDRRGSVRASRLLAVLLMTLLLALPLAGGVGAGPAGSDAPLPSKDSDARIAVIDQVSALVEVPPQETRLLRVDHANASLVPVDWNDPIETLTGVQLQAVQAVEPWLQRDLAVQLKRLGGNANRFANAILNCPQDAWVDEIAFSIAHTPPEVLAQVGDASVLRDNARYLYSQDADIAYADLVERTGDDGNYTTLSYLNDTGVRHEYPRDIYYWYIAHARVFWEPPARVSGLSFWRKAYWDEITWQDSGTLKGHLAGAGNIYEAANASTIWMQMNMEFGYGTNPLQPVQVILERYGSCGQYSITTASSMKVAMIPARVCIYPASDHQWCEVFIDGHWMHVDASNDVAGAATVKEPELVRRTNTVNFNDAGVFERGWKPYMAATSTFRSDDVVINSIDISAPDPSYTFRESGMTERLGAAPHEYTPTSTVTINVRDASGDPIEGAYVGVYRVGHDIYNPSTPDYPHFAYANYTNATGQAEFQLGLQGYCNRCGDDHYYAALILSRYYGGTDDFFAFHVPEEGQEYSFSYTVTGDAPKQVEPQWTGRTLIEGPPGGPGEFNLNISLEAWGRQRHNHGEWSQYETFGFGTTFDHLFPSDVDVMVANAFGLQDLYAGRTVSAFLGARDSSSLEGDVWIPHDEDIYLVLANTDSHFTTKVVNVTVDLSVVCKPVLGIASPQLHGTYSTDDPLPFIGTVSDYVPITRIEVSLDDGETWIDLTDGYDATNGTFEAYVDVSALSSGDYILWLRVTDAVGASNNFIPFVALDADDPELRVLYPMDGDIRAGLTGVIGVTVNASDNLGLDRVETRWSDGPWVALNESGEHGGTHETLLEVGDRVGSVTLEVRAVDIVGRTTVRTMDLVIDVIKPSLELVDPEPGDEVVVGAGWTLDVEGSVWDDHGIKSLMYSIDGGDEMDVTGSLGETGRFTFQLDTTGWEEGEHTVTVLVADLVYYRAWKEFTVVVDATPPTLTLEQLDAFYDDGDDVDLTGTVTDAHGVEGLWVSVDGEDEEAVSLDLAGGFGRPLPSGSEAVGTHTVTVRAMDRLGNEVSRTLSYEVLDETDPVLTLDSPAPGAVIGRGSSIHLSGTAVDNVAVVSLTLRLGTEETQFILEDLDPLLGQWTVNVGTAQRALGQLVIEVRAEDAAGNMAAVSVIVSIADRTDPSASLDVDPLKPPRVESGKALELLARFSDDVAVTKVEYRVDGWTWIPVPCELPCNEWVVEVPSKGLSTGGHVLDVRVTDAAGNDVVVTTPFEVEPVPERTSVSTGLLAGVVVAVVLVLVLVYMLVLRPRSGPGPGEPAPEPVPADGSEAPTEDVTVEVPGPEEEPGGV